LALTLAFATADNGRALGAGRIAGAAGATDGCGIALALADTNGGSDSSNESMLSSSITVRDPTFFPISSPAAKYSCPFVFPQPTRANAIFFGTKLFLFAILDLTRARTRTDARRCSLTSDMAEKRAASKDFGVRFP
jgi:hypothetical protein